MAAENEQHDELHSSEVNENGGIGRDEDTKAGWLEKRSEEDGHGWTWKKRYFVLKDNRLKYYKKDNLKTLQGEIHLDGCFLEAVDENKYHQKFCLEIQSTKKNRVHVLSAESDADRKEWMTQIKFASLRARKQKAQANRDKQISALLEEQEEAAKRRLSSDSDSVNNRAADVTQSQQERARKHTVSFNLPQEKRAPEPNKMNENGDDRALAVDNAAQPKYQTISPRADAQDKVKYQQYLDWLQETQAQQRRGTMAFAGKDSMNEQLLNGQQKEPQPCWQGCCTM